MSLPCLLTFGFLVLLILNVLIVSAPPNPGIFPQAKRTYYYAYVPYYATAAEYYKINCDSLGRNCRTALRYKSVSRSKRVLKSRTIYACPYGYQIIGNTCHYIKNVNPQSTRPADKTSNSKTTVILVVSIPSGIVGIICSCTYKLWRRCCSGDRN